MIRIPDYPSWLPSLEFLSENTRRSIKNNLPIIAIGLIGIIVIMRRRK